MNSAGATTPQSSRSSGKSLRFKVTMKSARHDSAQRQNLSSSGSGEISNVHRTVTHSARFRIRFTTLPMRLGRTPSRFKISLYSLRISSVTSQTKFPVSAHLRSRSALGLRPETNGSRKPDMPAMRTLVSNTTLVLRLLILCGNRDLRSALLPSIAADCLQDLLL